MAEELHRRAGVREKPQDASGAVDEPDGAAEREGPEAALDRSQRAGRAARHGAQKAGARQGVTGVPGPGSRRSATAHALREGQRHEDAVAVFAV